MYKELRVNQGVPIIVIDEQRSVDSGSKSGDRGPVRAEVQVPAEVHVPAGIRGQAKETIADVLKTCDKRKVREKMDGDPDHSTTKRYKKGKRRKRKEKCAFDRKEERAKVMFSDFVSLEMIPEWVKQDCNAGLQ